MHGLQKLIDQTLKQYEKKHQDPQTQRRPGQNLGMSNHETTVGSAAQAGVNRVGKLIKPIN